MKVNLTLVFYRTSYWLYVDGIQGQRYDTETMPYRLFAIGVVHTLHCLGYEVAVWRVDLTEELQSFCELTQRVDLNQCLSQLLDLKPELWTNCASMTSLG